MSHDPKRIVISGYDVVADAYLERFGVSAVRQKWLGRLIDGLPVGGGRVLDLGCGAGIPVARDLAARGHTVTGVDGSTKQVAKARWNVPDAIFLEAEQGPLIQNIARWLKPGGMLVASFGTGAAREWTAE